MNGCHICNGTQDQAKTIWHCQMCHKPTCTACLAPVEDDRLCPECARRLAELDRRYRRQPLALAVAADGLAREMGGVT